MADNDTLPTRTTNEDAAGAFFSGLQVFNQTCGDLKRPTLILNLTLLQVPFTTFLREHRPVQHVQIHHRLVPLAQPVKAVNLPPL